MMKLWKKFTRPVAALLAFVMVLSLVPLTAIAEGTPSARTSHTHPVCGDSTCTDIPHEVSDGWTAWDGTGTFPGGNVYLTASATLSATLTITEKASLCFNGHTLTYKGYSQAVSVENDAVLNVCDCVGTGGINSPKGTALRTYSGKVNIYGGSYTGYQGIERSVHGMINLYETVNVEGSRTDFYIFSNTYAGSSSIGIAIRAPLTAPSEPYTVGTNISGVFTEGWAENMSGADDTKYFTYYSSNLEIFKNGSGELRAAWVNRVSFNANGGTGTMDAVTVESGTQYTLPACSFTAPASKRFKSWLINGTSYAVGDKITVSSNITVAADWENIPAQAPEVAASEGLMLTYGQYSNAQISVTVAEEEGYEYSYQWFDSVTLTQIEGATGRTYTLPNNLSATTHIYACKVTATRKDNGESAATDSAIISVTVNPALSSITKAPEAKTDLRFNGQWQELVSAGTTVGGPMLYLVTTEVLAADKVNDYTFSTAIPKAANIGTYYVWYRAAGAENYNGIKAVSYVTVSIGKAQLTKPAENDTVFIYNGQEQDYFEAGSGNDSFIPEGGPGNDPFNPGNDPFNPGNDTEGSICGTPAPGAPTELTATFDPYAYELSGNKQTNAGSYTVTVTLKDTELYEWADGTNGVLTYHFEIKEKEIRTDWSDTEFTYDGSAHAPTATSADFIPGDDVTLTVSGEQVAVGIGYTATATITGAKAGNYKFAEEAVTTANFDIQKADQTAPAAGKTDETIWCKRDGAITGVDASMEYRLEGEEDYTDISGDTVTDLAAGKYYVRRKGDDNHNPSPDTEVVIAAGKALKVTIPQNQVGYTLTVDRTEFEYRSGPTITLHIAEGYTKGDNFAVRFNGVDMQWGDWTQIGTQGATTDVVLTVEGVERITYPVTFSANGGSGSMPAQDTVGDYELPECTLTAPEGQEFKAWSIDGKEYQPGDTVTITGNTEVKALWKEVPQAPAEPTEPEESNPGGVPGEVQPEETEPEDDDPDEDEPGKGEPGKDEPGKDEPGKDDDKDDSDKDDADKDDSEDEDIIKTGDDSRLALWIAMLTVSTLALAAALISGRKKENA